MKSAGVKVRFSVATGTAGELPPITSPSLTSLTVTGITTLVVGSLLIPTVNVTVFPDPVSVVESPPATAGTITAAVSLSVFSTLTACVASAAYAASPVAGPTVTLYVTLSPGTGADTSSCPFTVTVCATLQSVDVKVRCAVSTSVSGPPDTSPSATFPLVTATTTSDTGCVFSFTVNVAVVPFSDVTSGTGVAVTVIPAVSSSVFVTTTVFCGSDAYSAAPAGGPTVTL